MCYNFDMKIMITGFEPFGGETVNPSWEAVKRLPDVIAGAQICRVQVPVVRYQALECIKANVSFFRPDAVISVGQAGGRKEITPERIGINCDDYGIADNAGNKPFDEKIFADGPDAYFATLPVHAMTDAIKARGIPAAISNSAGTYVCNHVLYGTRYFLQKEHPEIISGFIHVPFMTEQVAERPGTSALSLEQITEGLEAAVTAVAEALR